MPSAICKARDPRTCRYHGAVIRMNEAHNSGDFNAYFEARKIVEEAERDGFDEFDFNDLLGLTDSPVSQNLIDEMNQPPVNVSTGKILSPSELTAMMNGEEDNVTPRSDGVRAQSGEILDTIISVDPNYPDSPVTFHRRRDGVYADTPYHIRIQANRKLDDQDVEKLASLLGYSYRTTVAGESLGWPVRDTPYSFFVAADTTKSQRDDLGMAISDLENQYPAMLQDGSPLRQRSTRYGATGTRAIEGFHDPSLKVEIYYDDVA